MNDITVTLTFKAREGVSEDVARREVDRLIDRWSDVFDRLTTAKFITFEDWQVDGCGRVERDNP